VLNPHTIRVQRYSIKTGGFSSEEIELIAQIYRKEIGMGFLSSLGPEPLSLRTAIEALTFAVWRRRSGLPGAQVLNFAVQPDYRGTGLANSLFLEMMRQFWR
jgi:predicted acetyltransferase